MASLRPRAGRLGVYVSLEAHRGYVLVAMVVLVLLGLIGLLEELQDVGDGAYDTTDAVFVVLASLPSRLISFLPFVALLGSLFALGELARRNELVALATLGVSRGRLAFWIAVPALMWSGVGLYLDGEVAAPLYRQAMLTRSLRVADDANVLSGSGFWARGNDTVVNIAELEAGTVPRDIRIYDVAPDGRLRSAREAGFAQVLGDGDWRLHDVRERRFGDTTGTRTRDGDTWEPLWGRDAPIEPVPLDSLSLPELARYVRYLVRTEQSSRQAETVLWRRAMLPPATLIMALLAVPFGAGSARSSRIGRRLATGAAVGLAFFLADQMLLNVGLLLQVPAWLTALTPVVLGLGLFALLQRRTR